MEDGRAAAVLEHQRENAHGESILPLIEQALGQAGWSRRQLDRVAVGIGPGSFTGLRVGIAIAQGVSEGLQIPLVGVPSLQAMALAVPPDLPGPRCVLVDARKGELFAAVYTADGGERLGVQLISSSDALERIIAGLQAPVFVGSGAALSTGLANVFRSPECDYPHARWVALAGGDAAPTAVVRPLYVRDAVAVIPSLPANPLATG